MLGEVAATFGGRAGDVRTLASLGGAGIAGAMQDFKTGMNIQKKLEVKLVLQT